MPEIEKATPTPVDSSLDAVGKGQQQNYIDPKLEHRVLRKFDWIVLTQIFVLTIIGYMDRTNLGNARVFGLEEDLGMHGTQFNDISTVFYATYIAFEMPWTLCLKRFGVGLTLGFALVGWSVVTLATGFIQNYVQAIVIRLLLGVFESGLSPCLAVTISTIWDREKAGIRIALLYVTNALSGAFGGLIAYGIQSHGDQRGISAWRWLYIVEGSISLFLGGICWITLPKNAEEAWFLKPIEKELMQARKLKFGAYKGPDKFQFKFITMTLKDPFIYLAILVSISSSVGLWGYTTFLPTILAGLGHTGLEANYLTIPCYIFAAATSVAVTFLSDRHKRRGVFCVITPIFSIVGYIIILANDNPSAGYVAMFLIAGGMYPFLSLALTWMTNNLAPDYKRAVGLPLFIGIGNIGGIIGSNIYPASDGPRYRMGLSISCAFNIMSWIGAALMWYIYSRRDKKKDQMLADGITDNGQEGDRALDFRYLH